MGDKYLKDISKNKRIIADATLLLVAFIWGAGIPMSAHLARVISPLWAVSLRMGFAGIALFLLYPRKVITSSKEVWMGSVWLALIISAVFTLMTFALELSTASKQAFLIGNSVIIVPFLVWAIYRKKPQTCVFLGAALSTFGLLVMGWIWLQQAEAAAAALEAGASGEDEAFYRGKLQTCRFFFRYELPRQRYLADLLVTLDDTTLTMDQALFA